MNKVKAEAKEILKIIDCYFPKEFNGEESIRWLHRYSNNKNKMNGQVFSLKIFVFQ